MFEIRFFATASDVEAWLRQSKAMPFVACKKIVIHHTESPTESQWHGRASMDALQRHYQSLGWTSGPHCFAAPDGIWMLSPPTEPGTHAKQCNPYSLAIEMVGNANVAPISETVYGYATSLCKVLLDFIGQPSATPESVIGHRDCNKPSCPGEFVSLDHFRAAVNTVSDNRYHTSSPLIGKPKTSLANCVGFVQHYHATWSARNGVATEYSPEDIEHIVSTVYTLGLATGLDPVIAVAQMCHETGNLTEFWASRPRRNPAGIGVNGTAVTTPPTGAGVDEKWAYNPKTGKYEFGILFPCWEIASMCHVGRLLAYAISTSSYETAAQSALIAMTDDYRALPVTHRGCAPTIRGLAGTWAVPGTGYDLKIVEYANLITGGRYV